MPRGPSGPHVFLSENSKRLALLAQDNKRTPSVRNVAILFGGLALSALFFCVIWIVVAKNTHSSFAPATVKEPGFAFTVEFYKKATIQTSRNKNYLVATHEDGRKTAIWVAKLDSPLSCGSSPDFSYNAQEGVQIHASCYERDRLTYASDVSVDKQVYQINMTSERPISRQEAELIFGSVVIE